MQESKVMSKQEWEDWRSHPGTAKFLAYLLMLRQEGMEDWAVGAFSNELENARALGGMECYASILALRYPDYLRSYGIEPTNIDEEN